MNAYRFLFVMLLAIVPVIGCGTLENGYYDDVVLLHAPADLRIIDQDGVEIPIQGITERSSGSTRNVTTTFISLRSSRDHVLTFHSQGREHKQRAIAKLSAKTFFFDLFLGGIGLIVDGVTGNWNHFNEIDCNEFFGAKTEVHSDDKK